jgi:hypothetical protein
MGWRWAACFARGLQLRRRGRQGPYCEGVRCAAPLPPNAALASRGGGLSRERRELRYAGLCRRPESLDLCLVHRH